ncbi:MAG: trypsin-like peptidase domain-containing protein [Chloroflexi bacterium]|nr:trypsin-like peptidase domain-containing protein [Chloroflexota bacterium]
MEPPNEERPQPQRRATDGLDWVRAGSPPGGEAAEPGVIDHPALPGGGLAPAVPPGKRSGGWWRTVAFGALALLGGVIGGAAVAILAGDDDTETPTTGADADKTVLLTVEQTGAVVEVATRGRQSVVRIESTRRVPGGTTEDIGSGVVIDRDGHILTNAHVVLGTDSLKVILPDGSERSAILVGHDYPFTDVAVLQVGPVGLTPVTAGDSSALVLGQTVVAIGNPLAEFDGSVSIGVVSGLLRRRVFDGVRQDDLIQTDAAINPGNSGGVLLNLQGQFVGMPTAVLRATRNYQSVEGIAFALPANRILEIASRIISTGASYPRPSVDAKVVDISPDTLAVYPGLAATEGGLVTSVAPGGAADQAGMSVGDIVTSVGGKPVDRDNPFLNALLGMEPGQATKVVLNRNGRIIEVEVRLGRRS